MAVPGFDDLDFEVFHREELPRRMAAGNAALAARGARGLGSLAFRTPNAGAWTYLPRPDGVAVLPGDARADTVIELAHEDWEGLVHDYESAPGLLYAGRARCARGNAMHFVLWEPALRALYTGRPVFEPETARLAREDGSPLDPEQSFPPDADREEMAEFLRAAGYLCVRGLFGAQEIEPLLAEARALRAEAVKGDRLSWWAKDARGEEICCRVTRAADMPGLRTLRGDARLHRLVALADESLEPREGEGNGVTVIYKSAEMAEGLSDLPWHRDCGMGGHSVMCPVLIASVFLTPATPETGELRFLPGSHRGTCGFREASDPDAPRGVAFRMQPGDVTLHYGDVMHAAPAPARDGLDAYRISATVGFARPGARHHRGEASYNAVLHQREDGQIEHLAKVAERA
jgi:hypothetical protein